MYDRWRIMYDRWRENVRLNGVGMAMQGYRVKFLKKCKTVQATSL